MVCFLSSGSRSLAFDGQYIYVTSSSLRYLLKLGSGKKGTVKGLVYASEEVGPGWVVFVDGVLLHRKPNPEGGAFCRIIDRDSFKVSVLTQQSAAVQLVFSKAKRVCVCVPHSCPVKCVWRGNQVT